MTIIVPEPLLSPFYPPPLVLFVRDGIHSVADYNSTLMGVVLVVVVLILVVVV